MFKKRSNPKNKASLRRKTRQKDDEEESGDEGDDLDTRQNLEEAVRASKKLKKTISSSTNSTNNSKNINDAQQQSKEEIMHQYATSSSKLVSEADLATSTAQYHPEESSFAFTSKSQDSAAQNNKGGEDGVFRDTTRNKFLAGPIKASTFVRTTCQFDYQPDICKDYKDTGFCGFGDTCIYLHDRGDTLTGWQLEQQWQEQRKKEQQERELDAFATSMEGGNNKSGTTKDGSNKVTAAAADDGLLPFACHLCREAFNDPVVTSCGHYFCQACIMNHVRSSDKATCPICNKDTQGVFNQPTKLLMKKRRMLSSKATWEEYMEASKPKESNEDGDKKEG